MSALDEYLAGFEEEPGYLDHAAFGPVSRAVRIEAAAEMDVMGRARWGALDRFDDATARMRAAVAEFTGFRDDQIVHQPSTAQGLLQAIFGVTGGLLLSPSEFPSLPTAAVRASDALHAVTPIWLETDDRRVTPSRIREQLTSTTTAVAVSLVDARTGYVADLEGIRQVIGDRLLIVDAAQGAGVVDAPWTEADVIACGGQKWLRAGYGTGFLAVSDRAANRLTPVLSGHAATEDGELVWDAVPEPPAGAAGLRISRTDPVAASRLAASLEEIAAVGVPAIADRLADVVGAILDLADEYALPVVSPRELGERAGIVVLEPSSDELTALTAALFNHGVSVTVRDGQVRLSPHAGTTDETVGLLRSALLAYSTALRTVL